jgi:glyoxylase-like metal-dependent hydrolase (beta-lactamase superfamily II)
MDSHLPEYALYAIRYAERDARRADHFIGGDPHDGPMPMDYFVWAAIGPERSYVIDTGFTAEVAATRGRRHLRCPAEALALVGLDHNAVADVILTHMHYDHVETFHAFQRRSFICRKSSCTTRPGAICGTRSLRALLKSRMSSA